MVLRSGVRRVDVPELSDSPSSLYPTSINHKICYDMLGLFCDILEIGYLVREAYCNWLDDALLSMGVRSFRVQKNEADWST